MIENDLKPEKTIWSKMISNQRKQYGQKWSLTRENNDSQKHSQTKETNGWEWFQTRGNKWLRMISNQRKQYGRK